MTFIREIYNQYWIDQRLFHAVFFIPVVSSSVVLLLFLFYKFIYPKKNIATAFIVILISIPPVLNIFRPGTYASGDLTLHAEYLRAFYGNLSNGIFIPRWAADFCGGNGCPTFMFSYILPNYVGSIFHYLDFSYLDSIKIVLALSFIGSGISMYYFMKDEIGKRAGLISAIFYLFSPYHLIDLHFRGSAGEVLSYVFIPLLFLFSRKLLIKNKLRYFLLNVITAILLLYSHIATTVAIIPILLGYSFLISKKYYGKFFNKHLLNLVCSYVVALLLSAYYWVPAFTESKYTWFSRFPPASDFKTFQELLYSNSGYGFLYQGDNGYKLIIGYPHVLVLVLTMYILLFNRVHFSRYSKLLLTFLLSIFIIYVILMLKISKPFWDYFTFLKFFLAVWRLLVPIGFISSVIAGIVISRIKNVSIVVVICFTTIIITMFNWGNRAMVFYNPSGYYTHWDEYTEYTEIGNPFYDKLFTQRGNDEVQLSSLKNHSKFPLESINGKVLYRQIERTPVLHEYVLDVKTNAIIKENTFYFPGWEVIANNKIIPVNYKYSSAIGKLTFTLPKGLYVIVVKFTDTWIVRISELTSFFTLLFLILISIYIKLIPRKYMKVIVTILRLR